MVRYIGFAAYTAAVVFMTAVAGESSSQTDSSISTNEVDFTKTRPSNVPKADNATIANFEITAELWKKQCTAPTACVKNATETNIYDKEGCKLVAQTWQKYLEPIEPHTEVGPYEDDAKTANCQAFLANEGSSEVLVKREDMGERISALAEECPEGTTSIDCTIDTDGGAFHLIIRGRTDSGKKSD